MKLLKKILVILTGVLLAVAIYRILTLDELEKLDYLLLSAYSALIFIFSLLEMMMKRKNLINAIKD